MMGEISCLSQSTISDPKAEVEFLELHYLESLSDPCLRIYEGQERKQVKILQCLTKPGLNTTLCGLLHTCTRREQENLK